MEWVSTFRDYVPLFQTIIWVFLIILVFIVFFKPVNDILESINTRIEKGGGIKASAGGATLELPEFVHDLQKVEPSDHKLTITGKSDQIPPWIAKRNEIYLHNRDYFLVHVLEPSKQNNQNFDIFMFLVKHGGKFKHEGIEFFYRNRLCRVFLRKSVGGQSFQSTE